MKTTKINLGEKIVKITLVMRSAANFKGSCKKDFGVTSKGWNVKSVKKSENEYYILLKTTTESGGVLVNVNRLGSRFATELVEVSRELSLGNKDQEKKIFKKAHYELMENLLDGYIRRRTYYKM